MLESTNNMEADLLPRDRDPDYIAIVERSELELSVLPEVLIGLMSRTARARPRQEDLTLGNFALLSALTSDDYPIERLHATLFSAADIVTSSVRRKYQRYFDFCFVSLSGKNGQLWAAVPVFEIFGHGTSDARALEVDRVFTEGIAEARIRLKALKSPVHFAFENLED